MISIRKEKRLEESSTMATLVPSSGQLRDMSAELTIALQLYTGCTCHLQGQINYTSIFIVKNS